MFFRHSDENDKARAAHLRDRAIEAVALADCLHTVEARQSMKPMAAGYERLADIAEQSPGNRSPTTVKAPKP